MRDVQGTRRSVLRPDRIGRVTERSEGLPTTSLGNYEIRAKIGSGGMGDVFDAVHTVLNKRVAIKTLRKRYLDDEVVVARFLREGQLASRIRHPNIVDVTDVGMIGGLPCLVMEHLEGESLSAMIRREGRLPTTTIVDLLLPIIAAVDFAHDHGVLHRDLKPSNIFLSRAWNGEIVPKVLDFGISKLVHDSAQAALTTDSAFIGTPHYASPELMRTDKMVDGRSDQYSMGVILYEAATGMRPFANLGNNFVALAMAICNGGYPSVRQRNPDVPIPFEKVIQRAMALEPEARFLTMRALGEALLPFASERERLIWGPTFTGQGGGRAFVADVVPPAPSSTTMGMSTVASLPAVSAATVTSDPSRPAAPSPLPAPPQPPHPGAASDGAMPPIPVTSRIAPMPSVAEPTSAHPSATPPGAAFDRVPSFGAGTASSPPAAQPRRAGMIAALIGVSVASAVVVSVVVVHATRPAETKTAAPIETSFSVDLQVTPASAALEVDGVPAGTGRLSRQFPRDGKKHELRVSAPGYEAERIDFDDGRPPPRAIGLRPVTVGVGGTVPATSSGPAGGFPAHKGSSGGKAKGNSEGRPKTDNIDPWE